MTNPHATSRTSRRPLILAIAAFAIALAAFAGAVFWLVSVIAAPPPAPAAPVLGLDEECGDPCFGRDQIMTLVPGADELAILGTTRELLAPEGLGTAKTWSELTRSEFYLNDGDPAECMFAEAFVPIAPQSSTSADEDDAMILLGSYDGNETLLVQWARMAKETLHAERYPGSLASRVDVCDGYTIESDDGSIRTVTVEPLELDLGVAGVDVVAWTKTEEGLRVVVADMRYANVIIRTTIAGAPPSSGGTERVEDFLRTTAQRLAGLS